MQNAHLLTLQAPDMQLECIARRTMACGMQGNRRCLFWGARRSSRRRSPGQVPDQQQECIARSTMA